MPNHYFLTEMHTVYEEQVWDMQGDVVLQCSKEDKNPLALPYYPLILISTEKSVRGTSQIMCRFQKKQLNEFSRVR